MTTSERERRALTLFFVLGFGLPWAGWIWMQRLLTVTPAPPWLTLLFYSGTTIALAGVGAAWVAGPGELRRLGRECFHWRAGLLAWMLVLFVPIVWVVAAVLLYAATHGGQVGRIDLGGYWSVMSRPAGLVNLSYPITEEIAWRGFLLPHLMKRRSALVSALLVGGAWAVWHVPFYWHRLRDDPAWFASFAFGVICLGVIFAGVYLAGRSVLLTMLLHWHVNAIQDAVAPTFPDLPTLGRADAFAACFTVVIALIAVAFAVALVRSDRATSMAPASS